MANITKSLKFDLEGLNKSTNTQKTNLKLKSDKNSVLTLREEDKFISNIVDYSSKGGGNIKLKIRGYNKKVQTANNSKTIYIDSVEIENINKTNLPFIFEKFI